MKNEQQIEGANKVSNLSQVLKRVSRRWIEELGKPRNAALFIRSIADGGLQANKQIPLKCQTEELWDGDRLYRGSTSVEGGRGVGDDLHTETEAEHLKRCCCC